MSSPLPSTHQQLEPWTPEVPAAPPGQDDLPYDDGEPLESHAHRVQDSLLIETARAGLGDRPAFVGGNLAVYYSDTQVHENRLRAPDFLVVLDVELADDHEVKSWVVWERGGQMPDVVIEVLSPSTRQADLGDKKRIYERILKVSDYFVWDLDSSELRGWRLQGGRYHELSRDEHGRLECESLELKLGTWTGFREGRNRTWLRFFRRDGSLVLTAEERAEKEAARADEQAARADEQAARADDLARKLAAYEARFGALADGD